MLGFIFIVISRSIQDCSIICSVYSVHTLAGEIGTDDVPRIIRV